MNMGFNYRGGEMTRIASCGIGLALLLAALGVPAGAQSEASSGSQGASSGQSLGEYARHVRKTTESPSKPKVFDNDNLPRTEHLSIVGKPQPSPTGQASTETQPENAQAATSESKPAAATGEKAAENKAPEDQANKETGWKQWSDKIKAQQQQIELTSRELDVLQREYQLRAAAMYADAGNRLRNQADWDKQDAQFKQQIADKQKSVDDAKQKMEDLREEARKAGAPTSVQEQ
jgi:hypothetical protein